jgi:ABC-2 type transport system permease protein
MVVFSNNVDFLSELVRKGNLDLLLTKPVNSQFMISCQRASTAHIGNLLMAVAWLAWAIWDHGQVPWANLPWLFLLVPAGVMTFYSLRFFFSSFSVIFTRAENLQYLWYHLYKLGLRPDTIYVPWLRFVVLALVPVGLIASAPARLVLGDAGPWLGLWALAAAAILVYLSSRFWAFALSKYASASS